MLMGQRNSEEVTRNSIDALPKLEIDQLDDNLQIRELKKELNETKSRLSEVEGKFVKIKVSLLYICTDRGHLLNIYIIRL